MLQHTLPTTFPGVWFGGWPIIGLFAVWSLTAVLKKRGHGWLAPMVAWVVISGIAVGLTGAGFPAGGETHWPVGVVTNISVHTSARMFSLSSLAVFGVIILLAASIKNWHANAIEGWLWIAGQVTALSVIAGKLLHHNVKLETAIFDNPSMCGVFIALSAVSLCEFAAHHARSVSLDKPETLRLILITMLFPMTSIALIGRHTPIIAAVAGLGFLIYRNVPKSKRVIMIIALAMAAIYFLPKREFLFTDQISGRDKMWLPTLRYLFADPARALFGCGLGTTKILAPLLTGQGLFFLHNDWIQVLFELGFVGLAVSIYTALAAWNRISHEIGAATVITFAVAMLADFPLHSPAHVLFLIPLLRRASSNGI